jgi:hypothetical protein
MSTQRLVSQQNAAGSTRQDSVSKPAPAFSIRSAVAAWVHFRLCRGFPAIHEPDRKTVMNARRRIWVSIAIAVFSATASWAEVKTDYDRNADFNSYKTYSWGNVHTQNPLWVDRIKAAVGSALAAKGWTEVESNGDVSIMAMEMTQDHHTLNTYYDNFGGGWGWRWGGGFGDGFGTSTTTEDTYTVGTLVVDLFDTNSRKLIWRGSASDTLSDKSDKNIKKLNMDVQKMFDHFPAVTSKEQR